MKKHMFLFVSAQFITAAAFAQASTHSIDVCSHWKLRLDNPACAGLKISDQGIEGSIANPNGLKSLVDKAPDIRLGYGGRYFDESDVGLGHTAVEYRAALSSERGLNVAADGTAGLMGTEVRPVVQLGTDIEMGRTKYYSGKIGGGVGIVGDNSYATLIGGIAGDIIESDYTETGRYRYMRVERNGPYAELVWGSQKGLLDVTCGINQHQEAEGDARSISAVVEGVERNVDFTDTEKVKSSGGWCKVRGEKTDSKRNVTYFADLEADQRVAARAVGNELRVDQVRANTPILRLGIRKTFGSRAAK